MNMQQPLAGIKVIDLTRILSGPFCTMLLGDMGADVIKVEGPGDGDPIRKLGNKVNGLSWYFAAFNRNKRSLALDLRSQEGKDKLAELLATADVLVENYRPGVLAKMGFDPETLKAINPRLVVTSISGYGSSGPYADRPAFDFIIQAMSGYMSLNGSEGEPPLRSATPLTDLLAGLYAAFGVVSALRARDLNGVGQVVEATMQDSVISMYAYLAVEQLATGRVPVRTGNDHPITAPYGLFTAQDGEVAVAPSTLPILDKFMAELGLPDLLNEPRFSTNELRLRNREALNAEINRKMLEDTQENWVRRFNGAGVPSGVVQDLAQALNDPQVLHREMVIEVDHPGHGAVKMLGFPVKLSQTPCTARLPAPGLGEHTQEIMGEISMSG